MVQEKNTKKINYHRVKIAASDLFLRNGYGNTSMNDIADTLQIKKASLYHHIQTREQLLIDIVKDIEQLLESDLSKINSIAEHDQQKKFLLQAVKNFYYDSDMAYLILRISCETSNQEVIQSTHEFIETWTKQFTVLLAQKIDKTTAKTAALKMTHQLIGTLICSKIADKKQLMAKAIKDLEKIL